MSNETSLLKARYCRSVLRTASISPLDEARHLINRLSTEFPTAGTSRQCEIAEGKALAAIKTLNERIHERPVSAVAAEWKAASDAIERWMSAAG